MHPNSFFFLQEVNLNQNDEKASTGFKTSKTVRIGPKTGSARKSSAQRVVASSTLTQSAIKVGMSDPFSASLGGSGISVEKLKKFKLKTTDKSAAGSEAKDDPAAAVRRMLANRQ